MQGDYGYVWLSPRDNTELTALRGRKVPLHPLTYTTTLSSSQKQAPCSSVIKNVHNCDSKPPRLQTSPSSFTNKIRKLNYTDNTDRYKFLFLTVIIKPERFYIQFGGNNLLRPILYFNTNELL